MSVNSTRFLSNLRINMILIFIFVFFISSIPINISNTLEIQSENYTPIDELYKLNSPKLAIAPANQPNTRTLGPTLNTPLVTDENVAYAIICPTDLTGIVEPLAAWKTSKGVPAKIYVIDGPDGIYSNFSEGDNATKIHDFLKDLHDSNPSLEWVLLVGDEDIIPSRKVFVNASKIYGLDDYYYTDHYYAGLNNSWDQDGDGIYGEQTGDIDWNADLYVGRLPVNNVSEAEIAVKKILTYETAPDIGPWMKNATFWSGLLDGPNNLSAYQSYKDNAIKITKKILEYVPDQMNISYLYDYDETEPGNYTMGIDILDHWSAKKSFNSGNSIINFAGQAYYSGDELAHYLDTTGMSAAPDGFGSLYSYNDGKYSSNGNELPFLYLSTCSVNFTEPDDSNLEQLITAPDGGVIGLIGNSGKSYRGETENGNSYGNWWLNEHFWQLFFNGTEQPGKALYELKKNYNMEVIYPNQDEDDFYLRMAVANLVGYNLLGDPELSIWTNIPEKLNFSYSLIPGVTYQIEISVTNDSGKPIENARVCMYNEDAYSYATTDESGTALITFDSRVTGGIEIVITAHNYLPLLYRNKPPSFQQIPNQELNEDGSLVEPITLDQYISDPDNELDELQVIISNITDNGAGARIDEFNKLYLNPTSNWFGEASVVVRLFDGFDFVETAFTITVVPVNDPPIITSEIKDQDLKVGDTFKSQVQATDIENDALIFSDNTDLFDIGESTGEISYKVKEKHSGTHKITITVFDGNDNASITFTLKVIKEASFFDLYWFPITVIIVTIIIIIAIKIYSIKHPEDSEPDADKESETPVESEAKPLKQKKKGELNGKNRGKAEGKTKTMKTGSKQSKK